MINNEVILVNERDEPVGVMEKLRAHRHGLLHRAFSVFIFNAKGEMLLQQRAFTKYHSGGLWTNACCSHPQPGEATLEAAQRRLKEEMGFESPLNEVFDFMYHAKFENGLIEHEFDHVFAGQFDGEIKVNKEEVNDFCYKSFDDVRNSLRANPEKYTAWFQLAFLQLESWWRERYGVS